MMRSVARKSITFLISLVAGFSLLTGASNYRLEAQQTNFPPEVISYADVVLYNGKILTADKAWSKLKRTFDMELIR